MTTQNQTIDIFATIDKFKSDIDKLNEQIEKIHAERLEWACSNRKEIKRLYPERRKIYEIDITKIDNYFTRHHDKQETYFFRPTDIRFSPKRDFESYRRCIPTVSGEILDCNLRVLETSERVYITALKEIKKEKSPVRLSAHFTKVYVMIDKNTGYYKIGRSKTPKRRERTLQSEKPTIEMLFCHDARVVDEKYLHEMFKEKRIRGEWFDLSGSDLTTIRNYFEQNQSEYEH